MLRFAFALMVGVLPLAAQTNLLGVITDGQGAAVPDAVVTAKNAETSAIRKALTNSLGEYNMVQLQPGPYKVTVEKPGFRAHNTEVLLQVNTPATLDVKLELGAVSESVMVTAEAAVVNTENAAVGNPFTETQVKEIPLQTRNVVALLGIEPGVAPGGQVLGSRPDQNNVLLDGVDVNDNQGANGFNAVLPIPLDSVQEFRTTVAGMGADMGRSAGGQVTIPRGCGALGAGAQSVRRLTGRAGAEKQSILLLQLRRAKGPQRKFEDGHCSHQHLRAGHCAGPVKRRADRIVEPAGRGQYRPAAHWR
ncbi:exported hypothetical protein [Candidatus Sulfopaludibacter sp. SbA3]|nr:exported hypothetical protein [Candidatus Sulfopaludibacter sp. SbA3]